MNVLTYSSRVLAAALRRGVVPLFVVALVGAISSPVAEAATTLTADQALKALQEGNARFAAGKPAYPDQTAERRGSLVAGQNPFAVVLACSDSRVPTEQVFDEGLGDIFTIRVAGNVAGVAEIGSVEYGIEHVGAPLLLVLGHTQCGAVSAVVRGTEVHGNIPEAIAPIGAAVQKARAANAGAAVEKLIAEAVRLNVWQTVDTLFARSPILRERVKAGKLKVVGGVYDLETGDVNWLGDPTNLGELLAYTGGPAEVAAVEAKGTAVRPTESPAAAPVAPAAVAYKSALPEWIIGAAIVLAMVLGGAWRFSNGGMKRWTVGRRIGTGFGTVLAVLSAVAFFGYSGLHQAFVDFTEYRADARQSNLAGRIQANYLEMRIAAKDLVIFKTDEAIEHYEGRKDKLIEFIKQGQSQIQQADRRAMLKTIEEQAQQHVALHARLVTAIHGHQDEVAADINKQMGVVGALIDQESERLKLSFIADQDQLGPQVNFQLQEAQRTVAVVCSAALLLGMGLSWIIARSIVRPLQQMTGGMAEGAEQVASAAGQVSGSAQSLAEGASEQAASLEETSASLEELTAMTKRNSDSAGQAKELSAQTRAAADSGARDMEEMNRAMDAIKSSSGEIAKIVKTIDEIAFQTNILALNTAVEAARAGEAGMGFAVVAEEVRALAQRSAQAAKESAAKIEDSVNKSDHGVQISSKVAQSLQQILERARKVDALVAEIATASHEQTQGIGQVNTAVSQMDKVTQSNAGGAEESAAAAEELNAQSVELKRIVSDLGSLVGVVNRAHTTVAAKTTQPVSRTLPLRTGRAAAPAHAPRRSKSALVAASNGAGPNGDFFRNI